MLNVKKATSSYLNLLYFILLIHMFDFHSTENRLVIDQKYCLIVPHLAFLNYYKYCDI